MDLGKAQMEYDNMEPKWVDNSAKINRLATAYEAQIKSAILSGLKYTCVTCVGGDVSLCPVSQIAENLWSDSELLRQVIKATVEGAPDAEIGKLFAAVVKNQIEKIALDCAEDQTTAEE